MKKEKAPYGLLIKTDSYTGNFERELVAYALGVLDEMQKESFSFSLFLKCFWNQESHYFINSIEEYKKEMTSDISSISDKLDLLLLESTALLENKNVSKAQEEYGEKQKEKFDNDLLRISDKYLCYTYQAVDDWEQETFYNICSHFKNKKYNCDSVYIQLNEPLNDFLEEIVIRRIKQFFETNALNTINSIDNYYRNNTPIKLKETGPSLISIELIDKDNNILKKY